LENGKSSKLKRKTKINTKISYQKVDN